MKNNYRKGGIGAVMDEYERAASRFEKVNHKDFRN